MKRICLFVIISAFILSFFSSCQKLEYSDSLSCQELGNQVKNLLGNQTLLEYAVYDDMHIKYNFDATELHNDSFIFYSTDVENIDEVGIFHAESKERAAEMASLAEKYIADMQKNQRAFIESYAPAETAKLDDARVYIMGNYVIYTILSPNGRNAVIDKVESLLR
jgi:hypothetical protein